MSNKDLSYCAYVKCPNAKCVFYGKIDNICLSLLDGLRPELVSRYKQWVKEQNELINGKCSRCGANIEVTEFDNGEVLIRRDCLCNKENKVDG